MALLTRASIKLLCVFLASVDAAYGPGCKPCSSGLPYPCSHINSKDLANDAADFLQTTGDAEADAWANITNDDMFKKEDGFYVFAYNYDGQCVAHGARADFVGKTLPEIVALVNNPTDGQMVDDALQAGAEGGGGWTLYDWTNSGETEPFKKVAYTQKLQKWGNEYYLGVGFNQLPEELDAECTTAAASGCAEMNALNIVGDLVASLYTATTDEMNAIFDNITEQKTYRTETGFYPFVYEFNGTCVAHGANDAFVGKTLPEIVEYIDNPSDGQEIDDALQAGAEAGGEWVEYQWKNNAQEEAYAKAAFTMHFNVDGKDYYAGVGYNNVCDDGYEAMPSCLGSPNAPRTGVAGLGVCVPKGNMKGMKCGDVKQRYRDNSCCGIPEKMIKK